MAVVRNWQSFAAGSRSQLAVTSSCMCQLPAAEDIHSASSRSLFFSFTFLLIHFSSRPLCSSVHFFLLPSITALKMATNQRISPARDFEMDIHEEVPPPPDLTEYSDILQQYLVPEYGSWESEDWYLMTREELEEVIKDFPPDSMFLVDPALYDWYDPRLAKTSTASTDAVHVDKALAQASPPSTPRPRRRRRVIDGLLRGFRRVLCCQ